MLITTIEKVTFNPNNEYEIMMRFKEVMGEEWKEEWGGTMAVSFEKRKDVHIDADDRLKELWMTTRKEVQ